MTKVEIICTTRCPFNCPYCYGKEDFHTKGSHVPFDILELRLQRLLETGLFSNTSFVFIGGEPLIHPQIFDMVDLLYLLSDERGFTNHASIVTSGAVLNSNRDRMTNYFGVPNHWQLSFHTGINEKAFSDFLSIFLDQAPKAVHPIVIHVVIDSTESGNFTVDSLFRIISEQSKLRSPKSLIRSMKRVVNDILNPSVAIYGKNVEIKTRTNTEVRIFFAQAYGINSALYSEDRPIKCPLLGFTDFTNIVVDENGMISTCNTPNPDEPEPNRFN